jgi:hypothetical protein
MRVGEGRTHLKGLVELQELPDSLRACSAPDLAPAELELSQGHVELGAVDDGFHALLPKWVVPV